jgi:tetratricopeptide (TPR) repeat protein
MIDSADTLKNAMSFQQAGMFEAAEACYTSVLADEPDNADAWHLYGGLAHQMGDHATALERVEKAVELNRLSALYLKNRGVIHEAMGNLKEASRSYRLSLWVRPNYAEALSAWGNLLRQEGRLEDAIPLLGEAVRLKPGFLEPINNLGVALQQAGDLSAALLCYNQALVVEQRSPKVFFNLGNVLKELKHNELAIRMYHQTIKLDAMFDGAYENLGVLYLEEGRYDHAIACFESVLRLTPHSETAFLLLSDSYEQRDALQARGGEETDTTSDDYHLDQPLPDLLKEVSAVQRKLPEGLSPAIEALFADAGLPSAPPVITNGGVQVN